MLCRLFALFLVILTLSLSASPSSAQMAVMTGGTGSEAPATEEAPDLSSPEAINAAVARLSDDEVRDLLLTQLNANATEQATPTETMTPAERIARFGTAMVGPTLDAIRKIPALFRLEAVAISNFTQMNGGVGGVLLLFLLIAVVIGSGLAVEYAFRKTLSLWRTLDKPADSSSLTGALSFLFRRFFREIVGLIVFFVVARTVGRLILSPEQLVFAAPITLYLIWYPRLAAAISRFVLAPNSPETRLVSVSDHWAKYLHRNLIGVIVVGGLTIFAVTFNTLSGIDSGETRIGFWFDSAVYVYLVIIAWTAREGLRDMMLGTDPDQTRFDQQIANAYPYFAMALAVVMFFIVSVSVSFGMITPLLQGAHYNTLFLLLIAPVLDTAIRGLVRHLVPPMRGEGELAEEAYRSTKRSYINIGRVLVMGVIIMMVANTWDLDLFSADGDRPGIGDNLVGFLLTVAVGYIVFEGVSLWINRRLAAEHTSREVTEDEAGGEGGGGSGSRLGTVLPLARITAQVAIVVIFGLLAIGNLGIDITPLLAGAGILGLAIGFGAQKLVSDVVSGVFFLIDDAFRVGEYVEIGSTRGAVEKISIRSMQLRHHRGPVHTIPYGEIPQLTNYSRDWVIMKLKFTVPFDTDPNKVKKIFKKIGAEMSEDPLFKDDFLEPFKSQGVFEFDDVGIVLRGKFMAKPGKQFTIRKEVYNRVKREFDAAGIDFARREVRVAIPDLHDEHDVTEAEKAAISAAAAEAVQTQIRSQEGQ